MYYDTFEKTDYGAKRPNDRYEAFHPRHPEKRSTTKDEIDWFINRYFAFDIGFLAKGLRSLLNLVEYFFAVFLPPKLPWNF